MPRKRKTRQQAEQERDPDAKRRATGVPVDSNKPVMPDFFTDDAKEEWNRLEIDMTNRGVWSATFQSTLVLWCTQWASYMLASRMVCALSKKKIEDENDEAMLVRLMVSPAWTLQQAGVAKLRLLAKELGITPASCTQLVLPTDTEDKSKQKSTKKFLKDSKTGTNLKVVG